MRTSFTAGLAVLALAAGAAAQQPVRGFQLDVADPAPRSERSAHTVRIQARDRAGGAKLVGDPVGRGAVLSVLVVGTAGARETLALPPGAARGRGAGWRVHLDPAHPGDGSMVWTDRRGSRGPVRLLRLARGRKGFRLDLRLRGRRGVPLALRPPNPGSGGELALTIPGGDTWCVSFGGAAGGAIRSNGEKRFRMGPAAAATCATGPALPSFVAFESDPVRPLAISPDGRRLFVASTPDARLEVLDVGPGGQLTPAGSVPVGLEPVAVAARTDGEVWVVNHLSDSVSVVDVGSTPPRVVRTIPTCDEPRDLVFAGAGGNRAFVTTARRGQTCVAPDGTPIDPRLTTPSTPRALVQVFDATATTTMPIAVVELFGDTPRALATAPDGATVYAAVFHSGNRTTTVTEALVCDGGQAATSCTVGNALLPGGLPGPNPTSCRNDFQPETGLIVRFDTAAATWVDELGRDWGGAVAFRLPDLDVFAIDAAAATPTARGTGWPGVGTVLFGMATNPLTGTLYVSNTEANNATRFEGDRTGSCTTSTVRGRLHEARITVLAGDSVLPRHLNKHLEPYDTTPAPADKARSLATPIALATDGTTLWVAAFGSGQVSVFDVAALEDDSFVPSAADHVTVTGGGPSGLVLRDGRLYVATRFDNGVSVIDTTARTEIAHVRLHDPEPPTLVNGRPFLYDAVATSANGEASCSSCHVFGDLDGLAWDLGNPDGATLGNPNPFELDVGQDSTFRAMKGPMTTQSLRGMANHGPMHWRGDRTGGSVPGGDPLDEVAAFHAFNPAFVGLLGRSAQLTDAEMEAFTEFALQLRYPPNPIRDLDGVLTEAQERGRRTYFESITDGASPCNGCHVLDPAAGFFGTDGESSFEAEPQVFKIPHLRNLYQKVGMFGMPPVPTLRLQDTAPAGDQIRGFGFLHDGSIDTLPRFLSSGVFTLSTQQREEVTAFLFAYDTGLAPVVGQQVTLDATNADTAAPRIDLLLRRAATVVPECDVIVRGVEDGAPRGWLRLASGAFQSDRRAEPPLSDPELRAQAAVPGQERTWTCVPPGTGRRLGLDRDADGCPDGDDPAPGDAAVACD